EVALAVNRRALGHPFWLGEPVDDLPVEIVVRHRQEDLARAIGILGRVHETLAPNVHMRHEAQELDVGLGRRGGTLDVVAGSGRDPQVVLGNPPRERLVPGWLLGHDETDRGTVEADLADWLVVELEDQIRSGRYSLGDPGRKDRGHVAERVTGE